MNHKLRVLDVYFQDKDGNIDATGEAASAIKVFSTVAKILRTHMRNTPTYTVRFDADMYEPSRIKLYDRLAKRIAQESGGKLKMVSGADSVKHYSIIPSSAR